MTMSAGHTVRSTFSEFGKCSNLRRTSEPPNLIFRIRKIFRHNEAAAYLNATFSDEPRLSTRDVPLSHFPNSENFCVVLWHSFCDTILLCTTLYDPVIRVQTVLYRVLQNMNLSHLAHLVGYAKRHISDEQFSLLVDAGMPMTGPNGLRRYIASVDIEAFAHLYFPDEFVLDPPQIHLKLFGIQQEIRSRLIDRRPGVKLALAIPRSHAKSTLFSRILPLHAALFGYSPLTLLLGNTQAAAERALVNLRSELEANEAIYEDFGSVRGSVWTQNHIILANGCEIRAFGRGNGAIRGVSTGQQRPTLVVADDLDDDQSVRSPVQVAADEAWWDKAVLSLGSSVDYSLNIIAVGTIISKTSLLSHILESPDFTSIVERGVTRFAENAELWTEWEDSYIAQAKLGAPADAAHDTFYQEHKDELLKGTAVLWPRPDAYREMMLFRLARGQAAFDSEIQNSPGAASMLLGAIPFSPLLEKREEYQLLASLDPTTKGGTKADKAAWVEILFHPVRKEMHVSFCNAEQRPAAKTVEYVLGRLRKSTQPGEKRFDGLWCEDNSAGTLIADSIEEKCANEGLHYAPTRIHNHLSKEDRIALLGEYAARKQLFVDPNIDPEFVREWEGFGSYRWDDAIDAAATIVMALKKIGVLELVPAPF